MTIEYNPEIETIALLLAKQADHSAEEWARILAYMAMVVFPEAHDVAESLRSVARAKRAERIMHERERVEAMGKQEQ